MINRRKMIAAGMIPLLANGRAHAQYKLRAEQDLIIASQRSNHELAPFILGMCIGTYAASAAYNKISEQMFGQYPWFIASNRIYVFVYAQLAACGVKRQYFDALLAYIIKTAPMLREAKRSLVGYLAGANRSTWNIDYGGFMKGFEMNEYRDVVSGFQHGGLIGPISRAGADQLAGFLSLIDHMRPPQTSLRAERSTVEQGIDLETHGYQSKFVGGLESWWVVTCLRVQQAVIGMATDGKPDVAAILSYALRGDPAAVARLLDGPSGVVADGSFVTALKYITEARNEKRLVDLKGFPV